LTLAESWPSTATTVAKRWVRPMFSSRPATRAAFFVDREAGVELVGGQVVDAVAAGGEAGLGLGEELAAEGDAQAVGGARGEHAEQQRDGGEEAGEDADEQAEDERARGLY
jgi:hypothetical protein